MLSFLQNTSIYQNPNCRVILFAIGAGVFLSKVFSISKNFISWILPGYDLANRYGKGTWAVITGGSDGIGKTFAFELASRGFNLVLISRNEEKLNYVAKALKYKHPNIQTKVISADFADSYKENFFEDIHEQVKDLDISILVNNAGRSIVSPFIKIPTQDIRNLVLLNVLSHSLMIRIFIPKLTSRNKISAIINISSIGGSYPRPDLQPYSASKVFIDYLSRGLSNENLNIDFLSLKPSTVETEMTRKLPSEVGSVTPEEFVQAALNSLGKTNHTFGHWKHIIRGQLTLGVPQFIQNIYIKKCLMLPRGK